MRKIEPVVMDYEGEPAVIIDGEIFDAEPPRSVWSDKYCEYLDSDEGEIYWDSDECEWKIEEYEREPSMGRLYGRDWYDCNTDWRNW